MSNRLGGGFRGTGYLGTNAQQPPECHFEKHDPTPYDTNGYSLLDLWLNTTNNYVFILVSLAGTSTSQGQRATWIQIYPIDGSDLSFVTDSGTANPVDGIINFKGDPAQGTFTFVRTNATTISESFTDANGNVAAGLNSQLNRGAGGFNTSMGHLSLRDNVTGNNSSAFGAGALTLSTVGPNSAFGSGALAAATTATLSSAFGYLSLNALTTGSGCNAFGDSALSLATTATRCNAFGISALKVATTATDCNAFGASALRFLTTGSDCNAFGDSALANATTATDCGAFGNALANITTGSFCNGFGNGALLNATTTTNCNAFGNAALQSLVTGSYSNAFGRSALGSSTATPNNAFGGLCMNTLTTGTNNSCFGHIALNVATTASNCTSIGHGSLNLLLTGTNNTAVGYLAGSQLTGAESNVICIGSVGVTGESAAIRIGTAATHTTCFVQGIFGVTVDAGTGTAAFVDTNGKLGTVVSSARYKENIKDLGDVSSRLMKMRPVSFTYKDQSSEHVQYGFIAEEVAEVFKELVIYKDDQPETLRYHLMPALLLNELQKQAKVIDSLLKRIEVLEKRR